MGSSGISRVHGKTDQDIQSRNQLASTKSIRMSPFLFFTLLIVAVSGFEVNQKAAAGYENCDCQCSSLTFRDKYGVVQGNCKSSDNTGAVWCYVEKYNYSCNDLRTSTRFRNRYWSYEACATPHRNSYQCRH